MKVHSLPLISNGLRKKHWLSDQYTNDIDIINCIFQAYSSFSIPACIYRYTHCLSSLFSFVLFVYHLLICSIYTSLCRLQPDRTNFMAIVRPEYRQMFFVMDFYGEYSAYKRIYAIYNKFVTHIRIYLFNILNLFYYFHSFCIILGEIVTKDLTF